MTWAGPVGAVVKFDAEPGRYGKVGEPGGQLSYCTLASLRWREFQVKDDGGWPARIKGDAGAFRQCDGGGRHSHLRPPIPSG